MTIFSADIHRIDLPAISLHFGVKLKLCAGVTHLVGNNGAGKTSLLKAFSGIHPFVGSCELAGQCINRNEREYKMKLGYCSDSYLFTEQITPREYLKFVAAAFAIKSMDAILNEAELIGLAPFLDKSIGSLSYGNKKKTMLVASIVGSSLLWLLDEPLNGLDVQGIAWLEATFIKKMQHCSILTVCHDANWLAQFNPEKYQIA